MKLQKKTAEEENTKTNQLEDRPEIMLLTHKIINKKINDLCI